MRIPTLHLNGTDPKTLLSAWRSISVQATMLTHLLESAPLNERDYYPQGPGAYPEAHAELLRLMHAARSIELEVSEVFNAIADEIDERARLQGILRVEQSKLGTIGFWLDDEGNLR